MKMPTFTVAVLSLLSAVALAQPSERPFDERPRFQRPGGYMEREYEEVTRFMSEHAPNRWAAAQNLPEEVRRNVLSFITARYRAIQQVRDDDPELYELKIKQLSAEDAIYGMVYMIREPERREQLREKLSKAVREFVELNLAERERRLAKLKVEVQEEEKRLANDRATLDFNVQARTDLLITEGAAGLRRDFPSHRWERRRDRSSDDGPREPKAPTTKP